MPTYRAPLREYHFVLDEFLRIGERTDIPGYADLGDGVLAALLEGSARICEGIAQPLNASGDAEGCAWQAGTVRTPAGFPDAYRRFAEGGWIGLALDPAYGGKGLPAVAAEACYEMLSSANMAFSGYVELSEAVFRAIHAHGSEQQRSRFLPRLASGEWTGAMHLTEPQAGSDLRLVRTRAESAPGGAWRLHGAKCFITNAEHDLAQNIVHLVLARVPGDAAGAAGLSLFLAPKFIVDHEGRMGARNAVQLTSIEHKMGLRAAPTGIVHYDGAHAELIGERGKGLRAMFTMVNDARLGVALQGLSQAEVACQNAVNYARERRQGRPLPGGGADEPVAIAAHPDVRRMLLAMRTFTEGARGLALWVALQIDVAARHPDAAMRARAEGLLALLTPVIKSHLTDGGSECAQLALQCFGGYGYVRDTGVEQFVRDVRITQIYEGTNGIQALDLVRRKLVKTNGAAGFFAIVEDSIRRAGADAVAAPLAAGLRTALTDLEAATQWMRERAGAAVIDAAAGATDYQRLFGAVALGWVWLEYAGIAAHALRAGTTERAFYERKLALARFTLARLAPETAMLRARAVLGAGDLMVLAEDQL
jgi:alkylation response protein AidB-like acyl-CoA dehydrogenase